MYTSILIEALWRFIVCLFDYNRIELLTKPINLRKSSNTIRIYILRFNVKTRLIFKLIHIIFYYLLQINPLDFWKQIGQTRSNKTTDGQLFKPKRYYNIPRTVNREFSENSKVIRHALYIILIKQEMKKK